MRTITLALLLLTAACGPAQEPFDVLITGGEVLDGTGAPAVRADVGIRGLALAHHISCPVYLVHGDKDAIIGVDHSVSIFDALASSDKQLWVIPGVAHGRGFRWQTPEYAERLVGFFKRAFDEA
jgi:fermentation-respiration switch protein FrsA (DUF1100 family)